MIELARIRWCITHAYPANIQVGTNRCRWQKPGYNLDCVIVDAVVSELGPLLVDGRYAEDSTSGVTFEG